LQNPAQVIDFQTKEKKQKPPLGYSLADLTATANAKYGFSADEVLKIAQSLYENHKLSSYPRTDCGYLPISQHSEATQVLAAIKANLQTTQIEQNQELISLLDNCDVSIKSPIFNDAKVTAHHAIIPTLQKGDLNALNPNETKVYHLILRKYLAQFYADFVYLESKASVQIGAEIFNAKGTQTLDLGWKIIYQNQEKEKSDANQNLPIMQKGDKLQFFIKNFNKNKDFYTVLMFLNVRKTNS